MSHKRSRRRRRLVLVIAAAAALAFAAYAFTASNTVPATQAGDGSGAITGYTVSNIAYQLEAASPANIDSVSFDLSATAGTVKVKVVNASATYTNCTNTSGNSWSCDFSAGSQTVLSANEFRVIAVQ
jgi:hypothetical protein